MTAIPETTEFDYIQVQADCPHCGIHHQPAVPRLFANMATTGGWACSPCGEKESERRRKAAEEADQKEIASRWADVCPREYRTEAEGGNTVEKRLDLASIQASGGAAMARQSLFFGREGGDSGIWLAGESGAMKTRLAWRVVRRVFDLNKSIATFSAWSFQSAYQDAQGRFELSEWMAGLCNCGLVFVDDIGKVEWSPNAAAAFFEMVERRTSNGKWLLFTSNHTRGDLGQMFGASKSHSVQGTADAITRRLKEFCRGYLVTKKGEV